MAKKKFTAVHRILLETKPLKYAEPTKSFMMEEEDGDKLVKLGAATKGVAAEDDEPSAKKVAAPKKTKASDKPDDKPDDEKDDLV